MNAIIPQNSVYDRFNLPLNQNTEGKNFGVQQQSKNTNKDKIQIKSSKKGKIIKGAIALAALAIGGFAIYYHKGMKSIKTASENPLIKDSEANFKKYLQDGAHTKEQIQELTDLRSQYKKYSKNIVGKMHKQIDKISKFFKRNFYNY